MAAEDLELTSEVNAEPDAPEAGGERELDISPEVQSSWDKMLVKRGLAPKEKTVAPTGAEGEPADEQPRERKPRQPKQKTPAGPAELPPARGFHERREWQRRVTAQEESMAALRQEIADLKALLSPKEAPDPDTDAPGYTRNLVKEAALEALGGPEVVEYLKQQRQEYLQQQEYQAAVRQENEFLNSWGNDMTSWEGDYKAATPDLAAGYEGRLKQFIEASDAAQTRLGEHPLKARRETMRGLIALTDKALQRGINPAAYVDSLFRQTMGSGADPAKARQAQENREARERKAAQAAGATLSQTKAPPTATVAGKMEAAVAEIPNGRGKARALINAARAAGGNPKQNLRELGRRAS